MTNPQDLQQMEHDVVLTLSTNAQQPQLTFEVWLFEEGSIGLAMSRNGNTDVIAMPSHVARSLAILLDKTADKADTL